MLDNLVKEFTSAGDDDKKEVYSKIEEEAGNLDGPLARYGKIYTTVAHSCLAKGADYANCLAKGADYAKNEIQRLDHILSKLTTLNGQI